MGASPQGVVCVGGAWEGAGGRVSRSDLGKVVDLQHDVVRVSSEHSPSLTGHVDVIVLNGLTAHWDSPAHAHTHTHTHTHIMIELYEILGKQIWGP